MKQGLDSVRWPVRLSRRITIRVAEGFGAGSNFDDKPLLGLVILHMLYYDQQMTIENA